MNRNIFPRWMTLPLLTILAVIACGAPVSVTLPPEPIDTQEIQTEPEDAETAPPAINEATPAGSDPSCNILQDLNLRFGPGTAYRPPIRALPANSLVTPLGFAPQGVPGGSWAYVQDPSTQDKGWVSAGPQFISCNIDLTSLPSVAFGTPQPYFPSTSQVSPGPGTCGKGGIIMESTGDVYDCAVVFSDDMLIQFIILKNGQEIGENDGVQDVSFSVTKDDEPVYVIVEENAAYCIFGGNGPCNPWVVEDNVYKWESGGIVVEEAQYKVNINGLLFDSEGNVQTMHWEAEFTLTP
ncbi:MAG: hypothetical protein Q7T89_08345 [Anaerolineales bacterium]|nr:hypothetical protein [Anaerolineales bacterium]